MFYIIYLLIMFTYFSATCSISWNNARGCLRFLLKWDDLYIAFFKFHKISKFEKKLKGTPLVFIHKM